ncbi:unnamed protein product, partial [Gulo gulo]
MAAALVSWGLLVGSPARCSDGARAGRTLLMEGSFFLQSQPRRCTLALGGPLNTCLGLECSFSFAFNAALRFGGSSSGKSWFSSRSARSCSTISCLSFQKRLISSSPGQSSEESADLLSSLRSS